MTAALWVFLAAVVGGFVGGVAAHLARLRWRGGAGTQRLAPPLTRDRLAVDSSQLDAIRRDVQSVQGTIERVLEEMNTVSQRIGSLAAAPNPAPVASRAGDQRTTMPRDGGARRAETAGAGPAMERRSQEPRQSGAAPAGGFRETPRAPEPPPRPVGPPPNAITVEARDDRIVPSPSYPPEAWVAPTGPAAAQLWINPAVALNEYALRRLSTFFEWQGMRDGAMYHTERPALLRWDEGQRVGTVTQRGSARPL